MIRRQLLAGSALRAIAPRSALSSNRQRRSKSNPNATFVTQTPLSRLGRGPRPATLSGTATPRPMSGGAKLVAPPMTYISGEEMTHYCMELVLERWINPHIDTSAWEFYDLSCKSRDDTEDKVLHDAVESGKRIGAIFKEPTVTPTQVQKIKLGLKKTWGSPNGAMRKGWNGITISRDTIHIDGLELGFKKPVLFERHAVGGEYGAGWKDVGAGAVKTVFTAKDGTETIIDERSLDNENNAVVTYHNPLDNVEDLAHIFFTRCLESKIVPYVVTKKTVFKWQEGFWSKMKNVFDEHYLHDFKKAGLLQHCGGELQHLISDAATMQIIRWTGGGFGMAAHNYDGDMLTDEIAQIHRSPGFITSNLVGKNEDGSLIKEFEASHGTVADMWEAHLKGKETSLNPLGLVEALIGAVDHSVDLAGGPAPLKDLTSSIRKHIHTLFVNNLGTRDLSGPDGLTTEQFVDAVGMLIEGKTLADVQAKYEPAKEHDEDEELIADIDDGMVMRLFKDLDSNGDGSLSYKEFSQGLARLNVAPKTSPVGRVLRISLEDAI
mmetsp:Transcript_33312/g.81145  ORF Transcript_33312/g.81145 Transcript_33312/m.81145 type:complete len:549 (-) Transcript_33312:434-2080(-)|eukprot:CAMPEP_0114124898 /NCGR_PEP_ID=MMETSP0043_2-20121206/9021_1 /TAXON_ID=464988 /ORGANISM="Hemiselmis andersenii, Strain CCMP644" /LENGTH=548 /DNA_ID=CAMNT_0001217805 /DNA_START=51 /DNA_END=1697 /DNA_ORIENTATION=-